MPYVTDTSRFKRETFLYAGSHSVSCDYGLAKAQWGYRSGVETNFDPDAVPQVVHGPTSRNVIQLLEQSEAYFTARRSDGWAEHDRTFESTELAKPSHLSYVWTGKSGYPPPTATRNALIESVAPGFRQALPPDMSVRRMAEGLARATVPERPFTNLTRSLGELKDAPQLLAVANYIPRSTSDLGGSYLNQVFGVRPTVGDMQALGEAVHRVIPMVRDEIAGCSEIIRTRKRAPLTSGVSRTTELNTYSGAAPVHLGSPDTGQVRVWGYDSTGQDFQLKVGVSRHEESWITTYGRYQRIVVRMDSMNQSLVSKLRPLLGSGLSADVIYDLTPYSWLLNWVWDFGSVLRYQEALNGADVVALAHGYTITRESRVGWNASVQENPYGSYSRLLTQRGASGYSASWSSRRKGGTSPYSLTTGSWSNLSGSQWAILAALGLARSPGVPLAR